MAQSLLCSPVIRSNQRTRHQDTASPVVRAAPCRANLLSRLPPAALVLARPSTTMHSNHYGSQTTSRRRPHRSEERRVGKESRAGEAGERRRKRNETTVL